MTDPIDAFEAYRSRMNERVLGLDNRVIKRVFSVDSGPLGGRIEIWDESIRMIAERPWTGIGLGVHQAELGFRLLGDSRALMSAHSPVLAIALDLGVPGTILYLIMIVFPVLGLIKYVFSSRGENRQAVVVLGFLAGFLVNWVKSGGSELDVTLYLYLALRIQGPRRRLIQQL